MAEVDQLCCELELTPKVKMMEFIALPQVCAMGVIECLRQLGLGEQVGIGWPADLVARREHPAVPGGAKPREAMSADTSSFDFDLFMGKVGVHAHAGENGPAASVTVTVDMPVLEGAAARCGAALPAREELRRALAAAGLSASMENVMYLCLTSPLFPLASCAFSISEYSVRIELKSSFCGGIWIARAACSCCEP